MQRQQAAAAPCWMASATAAVPAAVAAAHSLQHRCIPAAQLASRRLRQRQASPAPQLSSRHTTGFLAATLRWAAQSPQSYC